MGLNWRDFINAKERNVVPFLGGRYVTDGFRQWRLDVQPNRHGWIEIEVTGSEKATFIDFAVDPIIGTRELRGYLVGGRFIRRGGARTIDPAQFTIQSEWMYLTPQDMPLIANVVAEAYGTKIVYLRQDYVDPEIGDVEACIVEGRDIVDVAGVPPELDLIQAWIRRQREEDKKQEEQKRTETAAGRRALAVVDFEAAARAALAVTGAHLRGVVQRGKNYDVRYEFNGHRLECTVEAETLRIVDAGICLTDHDTGERGDTRFTLETLPTVVAWADDQDKLVVWRRG